MGDRDSPTSLSWDSTEPPGDRLSLTDRLPFPSEPDETHPSGDALQPLEAALTEKLAPAQLRAVASWMRAIAQTYEHQAPAQVDHSFRAQASRLEQLARQAQPDPGTVVGTIISAHMAYLMTATGQYLRQPMGLPGDPEAPAEPCDEAEFRQAYGDPNFTVLLGAEQLAQRFSC